METNIDHFLFVEKYRPQLIKDCIIPTVYKEYFQKMVEKGEIQNLSLFGGAGTGKTTIAKALCRELDMDYIMINCSENGNIDTLRTTIRSFASSVSLNGNIKCVILDEADGLTVQTQQALRNFIEEFSNNCRFIFTANFSNKIIEPLKSRTVTVDFVIKKEDKIQIIRDWDIRVKQILELEKIEYDPKVLSSIVIKFFPDFRKTLNEIQRYSSSGTLQTDIMQVVSSDVCKHVYGLIKEKKFSEMRKWIAENPENDFDTLARTLWSQVDNYVETSSIPQFVMFINDYDNKNQFVVNKEINLIAFLTECMSEIKLK